jgi:uncharacterized Zn finger protein
MSKIIGIGDKPVKETVNRAQKEPGVQINPIEQPSMKCGSCGGLFFKQVLVLKKMSKILLGTDKDDIYPVPVFRCDDCGEVLTDLLPHPNLLDV